MAGSKNYSKSRRGLAFIIVLAMLLAMVPAPQVVHAAAGDFAGGDGSSTSPYAITTWTQLNEVRNNLSSYFIPAFCSRVQSCRATKIQRSSWNHQTLTSSTYTEPLMSLQMNPI